MMTKSKHPLYGRYRGMIDRCYCTGATGYESYGGRGICVCNRWRGKEGFWNFLEDMGMPPSVVHTLDRKDTDGNYEPSNCRWATKKEQIVNRRPLPLPKSGYRGVSWYRYRQQWLAEICHNGMRYKLGLFDDPVEAAEAYNKAALEFHGPNAQINDL